MIETKKGMSPSLRNDTPNDGNIRCISQKDFITRKGNYSIAKSEVRLPVVIPITKAVTETGLSYKYLRKLVNEKKIPVLTSGNRILINIDALNEYLNKGEG